MNTRPIPRVLLLFLLCALLAGAGCDDTPHSLAGAYRGKLIAQPGAPGVTLELLPGGQGTWRTDADSITLRWEPAPNGFILHTKAGGVITGAFKKDSPAAGILVTLPGVGDYLLTPQQK